MHCFRASIFARERCYALEDDALVCSDPQRPERVPLSEIDRMRFYRVPSGMGPWLRRGVIHTRSGKRIVLQSNHYVRLAVIEDRVETYRAFVCSLLGRVPKFKPQVSIAIGTPPALWITWLILFIASCGVTAAGLLLWLAGDFPLAAAMSFAIVIGFLPVAWRVVRSRRAHATDGDSVAAEVLE